MNTGLDLIELGSTQLGIANASNGNEGREGASRQTSIFLRHLYAGGGQPP